MKEVGDGQIDKASALTIDRNGNIYLVDESNLRIQKFDHNGNFVTKWGTEGEADGQFLHPHVAAVDSEGNVYVTDRDLANVQKFTNDGQFIMKWGSEGEADGQAVLLKVLLLIQIIISMWQILAMIVYRNSLKMASL